MYVDEIKESKYIPETKLLKKEFFEDRYKVEQRRQKEFGMEFGLLKYKVENLSVNSINEKAIKSLHSEDVIGYDTDNKILYILIPATTKEKIYIVEDKLSKNFEGNITKIV
jgi:hypothetical protein